MRPHGLCAELAADDPECLGEFGADVPAARPRAAQQEGEVLGADDRPPRSGERPERARRVDADRDRPIRSARDPGDRRRERHPHGLDRREAGDRVPRLGVWPARGVDVRTVRHREDVTALLVDRLERTVRGGAPVDEVAGGPGHRGPVDRDLTATGDGPHVLRWRQRDRRRRPVPLALRTDRLEPRDPRGAGRCLRGRHRAGPITARRAGRGRRGRGRLRSRR